MMKLLVLTAVKEYEDDIKHILIKSNATVFSYLNAQGYKNVGIDQMSDSWFGGELNVNDSIIFMVFVPTENVESIYHKVDKFNDDDTYESKIHLATINLEKTI